MSLDDLETLIRKRAYQDAKQIVSEAMNYLPHLQESSFSVRGLDIERNKEHTIRWFTSQMLTELRRLLIASVQERRVRELRETILNSTHTEILGSSAEDDKS